MSRSTRPAEPTSALLSSLVSATDALAAGSTSSLALVEAALYRIRALDPAIQAWETVDADGARMLAEAADQRAKDGARLSSIDGVPIGIKDLIDTAGLPTRYGSPLYADHVPMRDAHVVSRLRAAGAVILGKTVTTEFATFDPSRTRNPWNRDHTPGGSSAGSAAAVAAGMVPAAIGTQTGGSTIRPASYCGVVGFMPSPGWVGRTGIFPCSTALDRVGLFGATVADVRLLVAACTGRDSLDPISRNEQLKELAPAQPHKVGLVTPLLDAASPTMRRVVEDVARRLQDHGSRVDRVPLDELASIHAAHMTLMSADIARVHHDPFAQHPKAYGPHITEFIEAGLAVTDAEYAAAQAYRSDCQQSLLELTRRYDMLVAPAAIGAAEQSLESIGSPFMNLLATFAGLPAIAIPAALADGLPLGVQLIGAPDTDATLLAHAEWLESHLSFGPNRVVLLEDLMTAGATGMASPRPTPGR